MTDKELRRLSRAELLEILIRLTNENEELKRNLNNAEGKLNDRKIMIGESGSIAEAALKLSDVFSAAESTAKLYLENSERLCGEKIADADAYAEKTREDADTYSGRIRAEADRYLEESREKAGAYWDNVIAKATVLLSDHNALAEAVRAADPEGENGQ